MGSPPISSSSPVLWKWYCPVFLWFWKILWNLGTRHLFSYMWERCILLCVHVENLKCHITVIFKFLQIKTLYFFLLGTPKPSLEWWIQDGHGEKLLLHTDAQNNDKDKTSQSILDYGPLQVGAFCQDLVRSLFDDSSQFPWAMSWRKKMFRHKVFWYKSNKIKKTQNEHLNMFWQNFNCL